MSRVGLEDSSFVEFPFYGKKVVIPTLQIIDIPKSEGNIVYKTLKTTEQHILRRYHYIEAVDILKQPSSIISLTDKCYSECVFCYQHRHKDWEINSEDVINFVRLRDRVSINLIGGEPLLHSKILDIIDKIYNFTKMVYIYTRLMHINDTILENLCRRKKVIFIVSVDYPLQDNLEQCKKLVYFLEKNHQIIQHRVEWSRILTNQTKDFGILKEIGPDTIEICVQDLYFRNDTADLAIADTKEFLDLLSNLAQQGYRVGHHYTVSPLQSVCQPYLITQYRKDITVCHNFPGSRLIPVSDYIYTVPDRYREMWLLPNECYRCSFSLLCQTQCFMRKQMSRKLGNCLPNLTRSILSLMRYVRNN